MASKKKAEDPNQPKTTPTKAAAPKTTQPKAAQPKVAKPRKPAASKASKAEGAARPEAAQAEAKVETKAAAPRTDRKDAPAVPAPTGRVVVSREIGGRKLTIETGRLAKLSDAAVLATYGDTVVFAAVNSAKAMDGIDFFPLTVDYRERPSAAGVIPGGFFKREGRPSTKEILVSRLIDRSIRPMFPDGFKREVQVLSQVLATDRENDPDVLTAVACFAALALSSLPHGRSLGMVRIGMLGDQLQVNPLWSAVQSPENNLNLTVAGHDEAIMMVEAGAKEVSEETMLRALEMAHGVIRTICGMVDEIVAKAGKPKMAYTPPQRDAALVDAIESQFGKLLRSAPILPGTKQMRGAAIKSAKDKACSAFPAPAGSTESQAKAWNANVAEIVGEMIKDGERQSILRGTRADGRDSKTVRPITIEVGVLPRVHGSVLFTRGETQALGVVTLGGTDDQQIIDSLMPEPRKRFMLHYNFPPFSVGEVKRVGTPGRREIGHGALAERGLEAVLPTREEFPYTIRITSEILESNGSSSMATACAGTLAMMDAGVAIKHPVAGIAMGLVMEGKKYAILTDILGSEDGCGDMDFKVVGTHNGITALQMDIKCDGLTRAIMAEALEQARQGRLHVLKEMQKAMRAPRKELSPNAPRLESVKVPSEKIGLIIGPGGKNIRAMQETFECKISIEDGGMCTITGVNSEKVKAAVEHIKSMTAEVELGSVYEGRVTAIKEFGAFIEILPGQEGLVHVSELSDTFIRAVTDVVRIGDTLKVKVIAIDDFGKVKLSRKAILLAERGGEAPAAAPAGTPPAADARPAREERPMREDRPAREERPMREGAPERGDRPERGPRSDRFGDRPMREDRPAREERPMREGRPAREERPMGENRPPREERPMGENRPPREERPMGENRPPREERPMREDRPARMDRPMREERPMGDRPPREERPDRPMRADRPERMDRPDRPERGPVDRPFRAEREDRPDRGPRPDRFGDRSDRGPRPERSGDRPDRPVRSERSEPTDRLDRPERDDRTPRGDRFADRGPRPDRFGPRAEGGERFDRPAREDRPERSERPPAGDRFDRPVRPMTSDRPTRPEQGDRPERGFRNEGRDRDFSRDVRAQREDRGPRPERAPEAAGERGGFRGGDRGPRDGGPRDRGPRSDRAERAARGDRANLPMNEFGDAEETPPVAPVVAPATPVGQLESIDSVLGDDSADGGDRRRGPRRGGRRG